MKTILASTTGVQRFALVDPDQPDLLYVDLIWSNVDFAEFVQQTRYPNLVLKNVYIDKADLKKVNLEYEQ